MANKQDVINLSTFDRWEVTYNKDYIIDLLKGGICEVTFTKVNGEVRVMPCTLQADLLPAAKQKDLTFETVRRTNDENLSVWCTDKQEWRSFKISNVTLINPLYDRENLDSNT
jgi:hypothetical protein